MDDSLETLEPDPAPSPRDRAGSSSNRHRYLVTGGNGFLGRSLTEALLERGGHVRVFDISVGDGIWDNMEGVEVCVGDVRCREDLMRACMDVQTVFHCASLTSNTATYLEYHSVNVVGTENVIDACVRRGVKQLIYTSSPSVVYTGNDIEGGDESLPFPSKHLDHYSATKATAEQAVIKSNGKSGLLTCALRPHTIFGPGGTFIPKLIEKAYHGDVTHIIGNGDNVTDFTYIDNVVYAHLLASERLTDLECPVAGQVYFITNGEPRRFWDFIKAVLVAIGQPAPKRHLSSNLAYAIGYASETLHWIVSSVTPYKPKITRYNVFMMSRHHWFQIDKARDELGYHPLVALEDAFDVTVKYYRSHMGISVSASNSAMSSPAHSPRRTTGLDVPKKR